MSSGDGGAEMSVRQKNYEQKNTERTEYWAASTVINHNIYSVSE